MFHAYLYKCIGDDVMMRTLQGGACMTKRSECGGGGTKQGIIVIHNKREKFKAIL